MVEKKSLFHKWCWLEAGAPHHQQTGTQDGCSPKRESGVPELSEDGGVSVCCLAYAMVPWIRC